MVAERTDKPVLRDGRPLPTRYTPMQGYDAAAARLAAGLPLLGTVLILASAVLMRA